MTTLASTHTVARPLTLPLDPAPLPIHGSSKLSASLRMRLKLAPRSSLQFKVGPQFTPTVSLRTILGTNGCLLMPIISPRIDRGFELVETEWVGYKRNYFTLVSTFCFLGVPFKSFANEKYSLIDEFTHDIKRIKYFALRLASRNHDDNSSVSLVQHTAKRDRGPQFAPSDQVVVPGELPLHTIIKESANVRNGGKIAKLDKVFFFDKDSHDIRHFNISGLKQYPTSKISKVARFERVQFTSSINFKKTIPNSRRFILVVELIAFTEDNEAVPVASTHTPPLIIRGRSPSNYRGPDELLNRAEIGRMKTDMAGILLESYECDPLTQSYPDILEDLLTYEILKEANNALSGSETQEKMKTKTKNKKKKKKPQSKKCKQIDLPEQEIDTNIGTMSLSKAKKASYKMIRPKKLLLGPKPRSCKKNTSSKTQRVSEFTIKDDILSTALLDASSTVGLHFPNLYNSSEETQHPQLSPMAELNHKENIFEYADTAKLTEQQWQKAYGDTNSNETVQDLENDFDNLSFDTSFGIARLFDNIDVPIPTFKKEPNIGKRSLISALEMDNGLNFDQELDLLRSKRLHTSPLKNTALDESGCTIMKDAYQQGTLPSALMDFGEFDEFPSFSLGFEQY